MDGEVEEVPDEVHCDRDWGHALRQGVVLRDLFNDAEHREEGQNDDHCGHEGVVRDVGHVVG